MSAVFSLISLVVTICLIRASYGSDTALVDLPDISTRTVDYSPYCTNTVDGCTNPCIGGWMYLGAGDVAHADMSIGAPASGTPGTIEFEQACIALCENEPLCWGFTDRNRCEFKNSNKAPYTINTGMSEQECTMACMYYKCSAVDPCPGLDCESQSDGCTSVTCDTATAQCVSTPIVTCPANKVCVDGYCSRDCDAFKIDDFLRDCSAEFEGNEGDISTLQTQVTALESDLAEGGATEGRLDSIEGAIAGNDGEIAAIEADLAGPIDQRFDAVEGEVQAIAAGLAGTTEGRFVTIETEITGINSRLDGLDAQTAPGGVVEVRFESIETALGKFSAHSQTANVIGGSIERTADSLWISTGAKDKLFMFLLILNTVLIVGLAIACVLLNKSRNSTKYQAIYSTETDDENQRLQR